MKKEILEEAIDRISKEDGYDIEGGKVADFVDGIVKGAKWQQERSYSEDEVLKLILTSSKLPFTNDEERIQWFEQFKKK